MVKDRGIHLTTMKERNLEHQKNQVRGIVFHMCKFYIHIIYTRKWHFHMCKRQTTHNPTIINTGHAFEIQTYHELSLYKTLLQLRLFPL